MANQAEEGVFSPFLQRRRLTAAAPHLTGRVLDIGCGNGRLAALVPPDRYLGVDRDQESLSTARANFPDHRFVAAMPEQGPFDTIAALAVIEHLADPAQALQAWTQLLSASGRIVMTTPHRLFRIVHDAGSRVGLFSRAGADEHEELFDQASLHRLAAVSSLRVETYRRFLGGANQLVVLAHSR